MDRILSELQETDINNAASIFALLELLVDKEIININDYLRIKEKHYQDLTKSVNNSK